MPTWLSWQSMPLVRARSRVRLPLWAPDGVCRRGLSGLSRKQVSVDHRSSVQIGSPQLMRVWPNGRALPCHGRRYGFKSHYPLLIASLAQWIRVPGFDPGGCGFESCRERLSGCSAVGSVLALGARGHRFKSGHPDFVPVWWNWHSHLS